MCCSQGAAKALGPSAEAILFAAARDDHVRTTIEPALQRGRWVICDRFIDSTRVYQGAVGEVDPLLIRGLERVTVGDLRPDLTFVLDVPTDIGLARAAKRRGRGEQSTASKAKRSNSTRDCGMPFCKSASASLIAAF